MTKYPARILRLPSVRLLPITILAMAALLVVKSTSLVRAASAATTAEPAGAPPIARSEPKPQSKVDPKKTEAPAAATQPLAAAPADPPVSDSERSLLTDLRQRRVALDTREAALSTREAALAAVDRRLAARVDELTALQKRLEDLERQRKDRDEANWAGLVKLYETMKPRDAAVIFNDLDLPVLLPVLDRMKEAKAAPIIAAMAPERARQATAELAQMRLKANSVEGNTTPKPGG